MKDEAFSPQMMGKIRSLAKMMTRTKLAAAADIDYTKLGRFLDPDPAEPGYLYPQELWRLAAALRVSVDYLCDDRIPDEHVEKFVAELKRTRKTGKSVPVQDDAVDGHKGQKN